MMSKQKLVEKIETMILKKMIINRKTEQLITMRPSQDNLQKLLVQYMEGQSVEVQRQFSYFHTDWEELLYESYEKQYQSIYTMNISQLSHIEQKNLEKHLEFLYEQLYTLLKETDSIENYGPIQQKWIEWSHHKKEGDQSTPFDTMEVIKAQLCTSISITHDKVEGKNSIYENAHQLSKAIKLFFRQLTETKDFSLESLDNIIDEVIKQGLTPNLLELRGYLGLLMPNQIPKLEQKLLDSNKLSLIQTYVLKYLENPFLVIYTLEHSASKDKTQLLEKLRKSNCQELSKYKQSESHPKSEFAKQSLEIYSKMMCLDLPVLGALHLMNCSKQGAQEFIQVSCLPIEMKPIYLNAYQEGEYTEKEQLVDAEMKPYLEALKKRTDKHLQEFYQSHESRLAFSESVTYFKRFESLGSKSN